MNFTKRVEQNITFFLQIRFDRQKEIYRSSILSIFPTYFFNCRPRISFFGWSFSFLRVGGDNRIPNLELLFDRKKNEKKKNLMGGIICNKTAVCFQQPLSPAASLYGKCHRANRFFISHLRLKTKIVYLWVCWFGFVKSNVGFVWLKNHMSFLLYLRSKKHGFFVGAFAIILSLCKRRLHWIPCPMCLR